MVAKNKWFPLVAAICFPRFSTAWIRSNRPVFTSSFLNLQKGHRPRGRAPIAIGKGLWFISSNSGTRHPPALRDHFERFASDTSSKSLVTRQIYVRVCVRTSWTTAPGGETTPEGSNKPPTTTTTTTDVFRSVADPLLNEMSPTRQTAPDRTARTLLMNNANARLLWKPSGGQTPGLPLLWPKRVNGNRECPPGSDERSHPPKLEPSRDGH